MSAVIITRADVVREARACVGVPFRHQHSDPRAGGLNCRGLLEWVAHRLTGRPLPVHDYRREPSGREFRERLSAEMDEIALEEALPADVVLIKFPRDEEARHAGFLAAGFYELMLIHAFEKNKPGRVVEEPYRGWPERCAVAAFRFRGIID